MSQHELTNKGQHKTTETITFWTFTFTFYCAFPPFQIGLKLCFCIQLLFSPVNLSILGLCIIHQSQFYCHSPVGVMSSKQTLNSWRVDSMTSENDIKHNRREATIDLSIVHCLSFAKKWWITVASAAGANFTSTGERGMDRDNDCGWSLHKGEGVNYPSRTDFQTFTMFTERHLQRQSLPQKPALKSTVELLQNAFILFNSPHSQSVPGTIDPSHPIKLDAGRERERERLSKQMRGIDCHNKASASHWLCPLL